MHIGCTNTMPWNAIACWKNLKHLPNWDRRFFADWTAYPTGVTSRCHMCHCHPCMRIIFSQMAHRLSMIFLHPANTRPLSARCPSSESGEKRLQLLRGALEVLSSLKVYIVYDGLCPCINNIWQPSIILCEIQHRYHLSTHAEWYAQGADPSCFPPSPPFRIPNCSEPLIKSRTKWRPTWNLMIHIFTLLK